MENKKSIKTMRKAAKNSTLKPKNNSDTKMPISTDEPIIQHEDPDFIEGVDSFTSSGENQNDWPDQSDLSESAYYSVHYKELKITSPAFEHNQSIPSKYTCDGKNLSPPLEIENIPDEAKCLALIVDDPDAPIATWVHWLVWNIPLTHHIKENVIHGVEGVNDFEKRNYGGPCPPSGTHRYFFKVYALDELLNLGPTTRKTDLEKAMSGHIIGFGELIGTYKKVK